MCLRAAVRPVRDISLDIRAEHAGSVQKILELSCIAGAYALMIDHRALYILALRSTHHIVRIPYDILVGQTHLLIFAHPIVDLSQITGSLRFYHRLLAVDL